MYNREAAAAYAHEWAYRRNPRYLNFTGIGGDCTNFISQCMLAGGAPMNYQKTYGWYYINANNRAPAWTSVQYLYNYLVKNKPSGLSGRLADLGELALADLVQLSFDAESYGHTLIVVRPGTTPDDLLLATHSIDSDNRPLSTYQYSKARFIKITVD